MAIYCGSLRLTRAHCGSFCLSGSYGSPYGSLLWLIVAHCGSPQLILARFVSATHMALIWHLIGGWLWLIAAPSQLIWLVLSLRLIWWHILCHLGSFRLLAVHRVVHCGLFWIIVFRDLSWRRHISQTAAFNGITCGGTLLRSNFNLQNNVLPESLKIIATLNKFMIEIKGLVPQYCTL